MKDKTKELIARFEYLTGVKISSARLETGSMKGYVRISLAKGTIPALDKCNTGDIGKFKDYTYVGIKIKYIDFNRNKSCLFIDVGELMDSEDAQGHVADG